MKLLGDLVSDVARALGFSECDGCRRRKKKLNAAHARLRAGGKKRKPPCVECAKARHL